MKSIQLGRMPDPASWRWRSGSGAEATESVGHLPGDAGVTRKREPHPDEGKYGSDDAQPRSSRATVVSEKRDDDERHSQGDGADTQGEVGNDSHDRGGRSPVRIPAEPDRRARPGGPLDEKRVAGGGLHADARKFMLDMFDGLLR